MVLEVDFDGREDVLRQFNARPQRTLQPVACVLPLMPASLVGATTQHLQGSAGSVVSRHRPVRWHHRLCPWGTQANCFAPGHSIEREPHRPFALRSLMI